MSVEKLTYFQSKLRFAKLELELVSSPILGLGRNLIISPSHRFAQT